MSDHQSSTGSSVDSEFSQRSSKFTRIYSLMDDLSQEDCCQQKAVTIDELMRELGEVRMRSTRISKRLEGQILRLCLRKLEQSRQRMPAPLLHHHDY